MDYLANAEMILWPPAAEDNSFDDIPDYDGSLDLTLDSRSEDKADSLGQQPEAYPATTEEKINWQEQIRLIHLRSHLNKLQETVTKAQYLADTTREELKKCHCQIEQFEDERDRLCDEIEMKEFEGNKSAEQRLQAALKRVCRELDAEKTLAGVIRDKLEQAQYELALAEVERGKFILAEDDLLQKENQLANDKAQTAAVRFQKEELMTRRALITKRNDKRKWEDALNDAERRHMHAIEEAEKSHERANKYLSKTLAKLKNRQQEEQDRYNSEMIRKMDMLLKLKKDIANNRENLRVIRARNASIEKSKILKEQEEMNKILAEGGNPEEMMLIKKRKNEMEKKKQQFEAEQKLKKAVVLEKILREEENIKRKIQQQPYLFDDPEREKTLRVGPVKKRLPMALLECLAVDVCEPADVEKVDDEKLKEIQAVTDDFQDEETEEEEDSAYIQTVKFSFLREGKKEEFPEVEEDEDTQVDLARPEFEGLWDKQTTTYKSAKFADDLSVKPVNGSKMEKEILKKTLEKTREAIVKPQIAAGREFSVRPFYSKPDVIHFKDFVVGKSYKKKAILTNVSYSVNYIRFLEVSDSLKDFMKISFEPPGQMSAGMSCEMTVHFKPLLNVDLKGEVHFLTQTGPFQVPLLCSTRKCDLSVDTKVVHFGTSVIGETLKRSFVLTNHGSLGTKFQFVKGTEMKPAKIVTEADQDQMVPLSIPQTPALLEKVSGTSLLKETRKSLLEGNDVPTDIDKLPVVTEGEINGVFEVVAIEELSPGSPVKSDLELGKVSLEESEQCLVLTEDEDLSSLDGMTTGQLVAGEIGPYSSVHLEIIWQPTLTGDVKTEFTIFFSDPHAEPISVVAVAIAIDVPVRVERPTVDLRICMFDRLYQDTIVIHNRATTCLKLQFEVCKELRNHLELLPKTGFIQAHSQFSAQLKFLPRQSLFQEAAQFFDPDTGVLEAAMTVRVAGQVTPVCFTVLAVVTTSDLEFGVCDLDFGCCTIHESVRQSFQLTNKSILPQQFGFVGLPDCLEVQPNDGFGTLLPLETLTLDVIFSPKTAKEYKMNLLCRTLINRDFSIPCQGIGVLTPLELSSQVINFKATSVYDTSTATLYITNSHTSANEFTHSVPRIGAGEVFPVGPTSFEFKVPPDAAITISPCVGTLLPGQKVPVEVRFSPVLDSDDVRLEALKIKARLQAEKEEKEREEAAEREKKEPDTSFNKNKFSTASKLSVSRSKSKPSLSSTSLSSSSSSHTATPGSEAANLSIDSSVHRAALTALLRQFKGHLQSVTVPCYIAAGQAAGPGELSYSIHNTLYLEVHCPAVRPEVMVASDDGHHVIDFGSISIGQTCTKSVTLLSISDKQMKLTSTVLDPAGPFQIRNAFRSLLPGETHTVLLTFTPHRGQIFQENLGIRTLNSTLCLTLKGCGVSPVVSVNVEDGVLDMRAVLAGEFVEKSFTIENLSPLPVEFIITQDSLSPLRHIKAQSIPPFLGAAEAHKTKNYVGPQNKSGRNVFDIVPATGTINPGETKEIMVTFAPDHESDLFSDGVRINLFSQEESYFLQVIGRGKSQIMYLEGCDPLQPPETSLACLPKPVEDEEAAGSIVMSPPVLITMEIPMNNEFFEPLTKHIYVGCVQTMAGAPKRAGDFSVDGLQGHKYFTVQPQKATIEADTRKSIVFTCLPPSDINPMKVLEETVTLTLKGDVITEQVPVVIRTRIVHPQ